MFNVKDLNPALYRAFVNNMTTQDTFDLTCLCLKYLIDTIKLEMSNDGKGFSVSIELTEAVIHTAKQLENEPQYKVLEAYLVLPRIISQLKYDREFYELVVLMAACQNSNDALFQEISRQMGKHGIEGKLADLKETFQKVYRNLGITGKSNAFATMFNNEVKHRSKNPEQQVPSEMKKAVEEVSDIMKILKEEDDDDEKRGPIGPIDPPDSGSDTEEPKV